jgi:hypothetical protein
MADYPVKKVLTANQLVALNLAQMRRQWGFTQAGFCEALEPYLGTRWSPAVLSAAERSVDGKRVREFSANEIIAIARVFQKPAAQLLKPPDDTIGLATPDHPDGLAQKEVTMLTGPLDEETSRKYFEPLPDLVKTLESARRILELANKAKAAAGPEELAETTEEN